MATVAEKQRELDALQAAFDEYVASSRELEEELDAEFTKSQNDLAKAQSRNSALATQLANIQPQLTSLETKAADLTTQLAAENRKRIAAEMTSEEAENKLREAEGTVAAIRSSELRKLKEENEELCERLAFVQVEAEDYRNELMTDRERHREEMEELKGDVAVMTGRLKDRESELEKTKRELGGTARENGSSFEEEEKAAPPPVVERATSNEDREEYIRTLEDELELVTEQLIAAETKLSQSKSELEDALVQAEEASNTLKNGTKNESAATDTAELESTIKLLEGEITTLQEEFKKCSSELELVLEELALSKEELEASEEDRKEQAQEFESERKEHKEEVSTLKTLMNKILSEERSKEIEYKSWQETLVASKKETQALQEKVDRLELALKHSEADRETLQGEIDELKAAFDETAQREKEESHGQHQALEKTLERRSREVKELQERATNLTQMLHDAEEESDKHQEEINQLNEKVGTLSDKNFSLTKSLKDVENNLATQHTESTYTPQDLQDAQNEIYALEGLLKTAKKELEGQRNKVQKVQSSLQEKVAHAQKELKSAQDELARTQSKLIEVEKAHQTQANAPSTSNVGIDAISKEEEDPAQLLMAMEDRDIEDVLQTNDMELIGSEVRAMAKKMSAQKSHNAELLAQILKLQGNIQVCCRIRPMSREESQKGLREVSQSLSETEVGCFDERTRSWKSYMFDKVWGPETGQKAVFQDIEPLALSVLDGYNACIFAYGQTGSGKTYTMEGSQSYGQYGISQRTIQKLFTLMQDRAHRHQQNVTEGENESLSSKFETSIKVAMLEIYNDEVYDLLDHHNPKFSATDMYTHRKKSLDIRHDTDKTVEVRGLIKESVSTVSEVLSALERGNANRAKAATNLNEHSSRSHMILHIEVTSGAGQTKNKGNLYLIDLAGSERVGKSEVEGQALKEAQHINKSLSALGNVMEALDRKSSHVPYRDSKLTYLLQNSLGGNSRTMMIVTACPHNDSYDETIFALKFATRVRRINLGSAHKNVESKNLEETVKELTSQISSLSKAKERSESQLLLLKREKERVDEKLSKASTLRANSKEEMRSLTVLRQTNNDITSRWQKEKVIREEKTAELESVQEELQRVQRDLKNTKRAQESLVQQNEDKENTIFQLKKDLRTMKDQLNEEKIRLRRSQVMQSRIPAPSQGTRNPSASTRKPLTAQKSVASMKPCLTSTTSRLSPPTRVNGVEKKSDIDPTKVARIKYRVLKMLQVHDPAKADRIDVLMSKFEGRETELLEKMITKYESGKEESKSVPTKAQPAALTQTTSDGSTDSRPQSRQDKALQRHMERMKRMKAQAAKD